MKVLMIGNHRAVHGGITSVISQILEHDWENENVQIRFIPTYAGGGSVKKVVYYAIAYVRILIELIFNRPDVIYMHMSHHGSFQRKYLIHKLCRLFRIPDVIHLHGSEFEKWYSEVDSNTKVKIRKLLRECSCLIVLGNKWDAAIKTIEPETKTMVINNSICIPEAMVTWNEDVFNILFLGVLVKRKGVHDLLKAVEIIKPKINDKKLKVIIAGVGEEESYLKSLTQQYDIESIVDFVGWAEGEKKVRLLETSQLLVLPSYNEGLPISVLEAIGYGLPIVASNVGDMSSAVMNGENGFLIEPGDVDGLASDICQIANNMKLFKAMSIKSREIAESKFADRLFFSKLIECFTMVIDDE